jgi:glutathione S-transferase
VLSRVPIFGKRAQARIQPMIDVHLDYLERELAGRDWFVENAITAADIMLSFPLEAARARAGLGASRPNLTRWLDRIHARPAYQRALERGGPYAYA